VIQLRDTGFLQGPRILLRDVRLSDVNERYCAWMNDREVTQYLETRFMPQSPECISAYVSSMAESRDSVFLAMVLREDGRHVGNIKLGPINWMHRFADIALVIGEKSEWGRGYATEAIRVVSNYAFMTLHLHKVTAGCYANNVASTKAFLKAGFSREGLRVQQFFCDGFYVDEVLLGLVRPS